eukprot:1140964-Pelagomonas_calceolata.AAC.1
MERGGRRGGSRLPAPHVLLDRVRQLRHLATTQDKYDVAAWVRAVEDLKAMPISDDVRTAYEEVLAIFPSAVRTHLHHLVKQQLEGIEGMTKWALCALVGRCVLVGTEAQTLEQAAYGSEVQKACKRGRICTCGLLCADGHRGRRQWRKQPVAGVRHADDTCYTKGSAYTVFPR